MLYVGIDPGLSGAVAILHEGSWQIKGSDEILNPFVQVLDTPTAIVANHGKNKREYLIENMRDVLMREVHSEWESFAVIESVHAMPGQGVTSMFGFGRGLGIWEGLLVGCGIPYAKVAPQTWKKEILRDTAKDKDAARVVAMRLFPRLSGQLSRKRDDGRAEALLMAEYARRLKR